MTTPKMTDSMKRALAVLAADPIGSGKVRVSNLTTSATIYWQAASRLRDAGLVTLEHIPEGEYAALTDTGRELVNAGGHR